MAKAFDRLQQVQEEQYEYPYHYIPRLKDGAFSQTHHWGWGYRYLGGLDVVLDQLTGRPFESLLDIGCGDGRFLSEVTCRYPDAELLGVDYSDKAINLARTFNPGLRYEVIDIVKEPMPRQYDVVTLIEVLEHIPPDHLDMFCQAVALVVKDRGCLILTVPHINSPVISKHYQHFTSHALLELLGPHFRNIAFIPFDATSRLVMLFLTRCIGGNGRYFVLTNRKLLSWFYRVYRYRYLYAVREEECGRLAAVCTNG